MGKARRSLWCDSLFSQACCTPEVPVSWAGRDCVLFSGPWGFPAVATTQSPSTTQKDSSTFSKKRFFITFSLKVQCLHVVDAGVQTRPELTPCPTHVHMRAHPPHPSLWELAPPHFTSASPGGTDQTQTLSFWKVTSGWRLLPHSEAPADVARTDGLHDTKALVPPEVGIYSICRLFPTSTSGKDLISILFCWCPRSRYL